MTALRPRWIVPAALVVYLITAWSSTGYQNADEHYQVIAFAEAKLGHQPASALPWEYAAHIRSALLPSICWAVFSMAHAAGVNDPFVLTFLLRLLTVMLAFWSIPAFVRSTLHLIGPQLHRPYMLLSFFLWFLPFLNVRFTGETWSGLLFLLGLASLLSPKGKVSRYWHTGIFFGLAFLCRPPVLMMIAGAALWLAIIHKERPRNLFHLVIGMLSMMLAGIALDSWFYGSFSLTAWNYARMGMVGGGHHPFTSFPWWYYFAWTFKYAIPVFGIPILLAFGILVVLRPRNIIVWATIPFLLLHIALSHKELRFLYPLAELVPIMLVLALQALLERWPVASAFIHRKVVRVPVILLFIVIDLLALSIVVSSPAGSGLARLAECIRERYHGSVVRINYVADERTVWDIRVPKFYLPSASTDTMVFSACVPIVDDPQQVQLLVAYGPLPKCDRAMNGAWSEVMPAIPAWKEFALRAYDGNDAKPAWRLYEATSLAAGRAK